MKRTFAMILALLVCLSLCACGGGNDATIETMQNSGSNDATIETTQNIGRIETDHPLLSYLFGTWKLTSEEEADRNPYTEITFHKDGTCVIEDITYRWVIAEEKETMLLLNILSGNEKIAGASLSCRKDGYFTGFMAMGKEDYNFCPGIWENTSSSTTSE